MKKIILLLLLSGFAYGQQINICNLSENDLQSFSQNLAGSGIKISNSKKTDLGFVVRFDDNLKVTFTNDGGKYSLYSISGKSENVKNVWKSFFNPGYNEASEDYSNTILKQNGGDVRLQKSQDQFYIEKYSCRN